MFSSKGGVGSLSITENDVVSSGLDHFNPVQREITMESGRTISLRPTSMKSSGPFEFMIPSQTSSFINLPSTRLFVQLKVVKSDGSNMGDNDWISFTNLLGGSLFRSINVELNGCLSAQLTNDLTHYKKYLQTILSYSDSACETHLLSEYFRMDSPFHFDNFDADTQNTCFKIRRDVMANSKSFQIVTDLASDFLKCDKFLPPGIQMTLTLNRENDSFALLGSGAFNYKIEIEDMKLYMRVIELHENLTSQHIRHALKSTMYLPFTKTEIKHHGVGAGLTSINWPNIFNGKLPHSLIIFLVESTAFNGDFSKNPYNLQTFSLNYADLKVSGRSVPQEPYRPDFDRQLFARIYSDGFENTGIQRENTGNCINARQFMGGSFYIAYDLSPDHCFSHHLHSTINGDISLELGFRRQLEVPITIVAFASFDVQVKIKERREIDFDIL